MNTRVDTFLYRLQIVIAKWRRTLQQRESAKRHASAEPDWDLMDEAYRRETGQ